MSTAIAEPPIETVETPVATTPANPPPQGITIDLDAVLKAAGPVKQQVTPKQEPPKVEEKVEPAKEAPKETPAAPKNDKETNLANLRKELEAARLAEKTAAEEREKLRQEIESFKTRQPELPEDVKTKLTKAEELQKELEETRRSLRQADLARDPEFQAKYTKGIQTRVAEMTRLAKEAGVDEGDVRAAMANWNENQFGEWSDAMTPAQRMKFNAAWQGAITLYQEQNEQLANADKTYAELQKQRQEQMENQRKTALTENEKLARSVMSELLNNDAIKGFDDLPAAAEAAVLAAARYEMPAKDVFHNVVANQVLARVTLKQKETIEANEAKIAELEAKLKEQEGFIAQHSGAVVRNDGVGKTVDVDDKTPIWNRIQVRA